MINLSITATCNRDCDYCFALDVLETSSQQEMSDEVYEQSLQLAAHSGLSEIRLLGGEPTLHSNFLHFVNHALEMDFSIVLLTGGLVPNPILTALERVSDNKLAVLLNIVPPWDNEPAMQRKQEKLMRSLGPRVALGLNIDSRAVSYDFLLPLIERFQLERSVRLGIAHPIWQSEKNSFLHPKHYRAIGERVAEFAYAAEREGVRISFDCGWVPCLFPPGVLEDLDYGPQDVGLRCNPIIDVLVDGQVLSCYPLAHHHRSNLTNQQTIDGLRQEFRHQQQHDRQATIFPHCHSCDYYLEGNCSGGCLAASLQRRRAVPNQQLIPVHMVNA